MQISTLFYLAVLLLAGLLFGRLAKLIKLPNVTGYLVAGLVLGPCVLGFLSAETVKSFDMISEIALAFIAFTIGLSFKKSYFKKVGMMPVVIAIFEAMLAVFFVQIALVVYAKLVPSAEIGAPFAVVLGAIAAATAPAATILVIKQYRAKGPLTEVLMSVVAIDDAVALVAFGFAVTIAKVMESPAAVGAGVLLSVLRPFGEVLLALLIGAVCGLCMLFPMRFFKKAGNRLIILVGFIFLTSSLATLCGVSELLACMAAGTALCNLSAESDIMADLADAVTPPIFLLFFVTSGAGLDVTILPKIGAVGLIYVVFRVIGKITGAYVGAKIMHAPKNVCRYLGATLVPQAGVAIGLTIAAQSVVPDYAPQIRAVILCGTLIYEIVGPVLTKISLSKAGEIQ